MNKTEKASLLQLAQRMAGGVFLVTMLGQGAGLGLQILLTRCMGVEQYGVYIYVFSCLMILSMLATLGQPRVMLRFAAAYRAEERWRDLRGVLAFGNQVVWIVSVVSAVLIGLGIWGFGQANSPVGQAFLVGCVTLPFICWKNLQLGVAHSLRRVVLAKGMDELGVRVGLALSFLALWGLNGRVPNALETLALSGVVCILVGLWVWRKWREELGREALQGPRNFQRRYWMGVGLALVVTDGLNMLLGRTDVLMLGVLRDTTDAGTYAVSSRLASLALLGLIVVAAATVPLLSERFATQRMTEFRKLVRWTTQVGFLLSMGLTVGLLIGADLLLGLFGPEFTERKECLYVLAVGQAVNSFLGPTGTIMFLTGRERKLALIQGLGLCLNVILNLLWIPRFGVIGAAFATVSAHSIWNFSCFVVIWRELKISTLPVAWWQPKAASPE